MWILCVCVCAISGEKFHSFYFYFIFRYCLYHQMMMMISNVIDHQQNQNPDDTFMVYISLIGFLRFEIIITTDDDDDDDSSLEHTYTYAQLMK